MVKNKISIKVGGPREEVLRISTLLSKYFQKSNLNVICHIPQGDNIDSQIRCEDESINSVISNQDILLALDSKCIERNFQTTNENGLILTKDNYNSEDRRVLNIPTDKILEKLNSKEESLLLFGIILGIITKEVSNINEAIDSVYSTEDETKSYNNHKVARTGFEFSKILSKKNNFENFNRIFPLKKKEENILVSKSMAIGMTLLKERFEIVEFTNRTPLFEIIKTLRAIGIENCNESKDDNFNLHTNLGSRKLGKKVISVLSKDNQNSINEVLEECKKNSTNITIITHSTNNIRKLLEDDSVIIFSPGSVEECFYDLQDIMKKSEEKKNL